MLAAIGVMIGAYIFTRMVELLTGGKGLAAKILATMTMLITVIVSFWLLFVLVGSSGTKESCLLYGGCG